MIRWDSSIADEHVIKAPFYKRKVVGQDWMGKITILDDNNDSFANEKYLIVEWVEEEKRLHKECFVKAAFTLSFLSYTETYFVVGEKIVNILRELGMLTNIYTKESAQKAFSSYPSIWEVLRTNCFDESNWGVDCNYICKRSDKFGTLKDKYLSETGIERSKELSLFIDKLLIELQNVRIDTSILEKKPESTQTNLDVQLPPWLKRTIMYGGVFALKFAARSIGQNIDVQIPDFDIDVDVDIDIESDVDFDIDATDTSSMESSVLDNNDSTSSNIVFQKAPNDGTYTDSGNIVTVRSDSGVKYNDIHVFYHNGQKWLDFKNHWIKPSASGFFSYKGVGYKVL